MRFKKLSFSIFLIFLFHPLLAEDHEAIAQNILKKGLEENGAYKILESLTKIGPRLIGSLQAESAVQKMKQLMEGIGLDVRVEQVKVGRWVRGEKEEGRIISKIFGEIPFSICALGGSVPTPENGIVSQVIEVSSFEELKEKGDSVRGKIVFFNKKMNPSYLEPFRAYGESAGIRHGGAIEAGRLGAVAVIVRSLTLSIDDFPHTGIMAYSSDVPKIPAVAISTKGAELLSGLLKKDPSLRFYLKINCRELPPVVSYNVIGEIKGREKPEEIVLLGAHIDSWDLGEGAHDDGAGCAHVVEALRLLKELGLKPKRTIRGVLFMDEESGGTGGKAYAESGERGKEKHIIAIESDRGGFLPLYFGVKAESSIIDRLKRWENILRTAGIIGIREGGGGVDIGPLEKGGTILSSLIVNSQAYFDYHHSAKDVLSSVHPRELELGAVSMAIFSYILAEEGI